MSVPGDFLTSSHTEPPTSSASTSSASSTVSYPGAASIGNNSLSAPGALGQSSATSRASSLHAPPPYAPFLSHMPPPADSWIEVETTPSEYKLHIRLPGFKRDGITLSTKRRRILHIVADSWPDHDPSPRSSNANPSEPSSSQRGGHFERRISFGYDADLVGVRAEFDGEMLKIVVPRRQGMNGAMAPFL
ncbi:hypothetical protein F5050DRAFT_1579651 [Lentinula boryana]|uniref:SHSP domain-containing protein n=1 Tax=Lentinula boryana TaxID=40481 RepID=A0ABQ8Q105_9AGAR|nr:hypothetical protein F5050DRAFT_1579651 [Lentinula boryana]